jgi:nicotinamide-nucleotide amidase
MFDATLLERARAVLEAYRARGWMLATAESCTGGLIAGCLTEVPGSSAVVERGFVTYTNAAKMELLGVPEATLRDHGAVSPETARAMAAGALERAPVQAAVAVTGVAGPSGGSAAKPVGLVQFALAATGLETRHLERRFDGGRSRIRRDSVLQALDLLLDAVAEAS